ncbi:hypothetical protein [Spirosoma radiotolerans]|uniref:Uncharacterized protein n=1 Tax=Spirosoma radiotolerans TaxID=1379870 RepID=A0A0E3ZTB2_9BACT|nr:hypothetical protein [Spirosoma radiotolerans]AKD53820.1 hypothetical protein SD10_01790 [Spirosoma radiotolerans]
MILYFTTVDSLGQTKEFSWWFTTLEFALDVLSHLSSTGRTIIYARLVDNGHHTDLPLDAFDGEIISSSIHQLEVEWQQVLGQSITGENGSFIHLK